MRGLNHMGRFSYIVDFRQYKTRDDEMYGILNNKSRERENMWIGFILFVRAVMWSECLFLMCTENINIPHREKQVLTLILIFFDNYFTRLFRPQKGFLERQKCSQSKDARVMRIKVQTKRRKQFVGGDLRYGQTRRTNEPRRTNPLIRFGQVPKARN